MRRTIAAVLATLAFLSVSAALHARGPIIDGDADGIDDSADQCLYSPASAKVDAQGCSAESDEDGDGIGDTVDACPFSPPHAQVDAHGCALDDDFDGVANGLDRCAFSELGAPVDTFGCAGGLASRSLAAPARAIAPSTPAAVARPAPVASVAAVPVPTAARPVTTVVSAPAASSVRADGADSLLTLNFTPGGAHLGVAGARRLRDAVPKLKQTLGDDRLAVIVVEGFAEAGVDGPEADTLARTRANRVRRLLAEEGVDESRLRSLGRGASAASGSDKSPRRVELVLDRE